MRLGLLLSVSMHALVLFWALVGIHSSKPLEPPKPDPVEVSIISVKDLETRQRKGDERAKQLETAAQPKQPPTPVVARQEAPKPPPPSEAAPPPPPPPPPEPKADPIADKLAALTTPPPPPPAPAPTPPPKGPSAEDKQKLEEALAVEQRRAEAEAKAKEAERQKEVQRKKDEERRKEQARKREEQRKRDEAKRKEQERQEKVAKEREMRDRLRQKLAEAEDAPPKDLLDRDPRKRGATPPGAEAPAKTKEKGPAAGTRTGNDTRLTAREEDMLKRAIDQALAHCWRKPLIGGAERAPVVTAKWRLTQDGYLDGEPQVLDRITSAPVETAAREAVSAVKKCSGKFGLPPNLYAHWREIEWEFDPNRP